MNTETPLHADRRPSSSVTLKLAAAVFKKELGLFRSRTDQVVFVVGTFWVGWAARLGSQQSQFWILAILTFYVPLASP
jgi:hypothetical protein